MKKEHLLNALCFEIGKCKTEMVKINAVAILNQIDRQMAEEVANTIGVPLPKENHEVDSTKKSPALSMANTIFKADTKKVAILLNGTPDETLLREWMMKLLENKVNYCLVDKKIYELNQIGKISETYDIADPTLFDAVLLISSDSNIDTRALEFIDTAYKHYKPIALSLSHPKSIEFSRVKLNSPGVYDLTSLKINPFINGIAKGRFWDREV